MANNVGVKLDYDKIIRPNLPEVVKKYKIFGYLFMALCVLAIVIFALIIALVVKNFGSWYLFLLIAPLALFLVGAVFAVRYGTYSSIGKVYLEEIEEIKLKDFVVLEEFMGAHPDTPMIARKIIDTGNLDGYELIADKVIAKTALAMTADDAEIKYKEYKGTAV